MNKLGFLLLILATCILLVGVPKLGLLYDPISLVYFLMFFYGSTLFCHGSNGIRISLAGIKYLIVEPSYSDTKTKDILKSQLKLAFLAGFLGSLVQIMGMLSVTASYSILSQALSLAIMPMFYALVYVSVLIYPVYVKLSAHT